MNQDIRAPYYGELGRLSFSPGWARPEPAMWPSPRAQVQAGGVALRGRPRRAASGRRVRSGRAGRAPQPDHGQSDRRQHLCLQPQHRRRLPDGESRRESALAPAHRGGVAAGGRGQARHLHRRRRRPRRHAARRRGADAVLVLARPRQRERRHQLLDRLSRCAVRAAFGGDVLRAEPGRLRRDPLQRSVALPHPRARGAGTGQRRQGGRDRQGRAPHDRPASPTASRRRKTRGGEDHGQPSLLRHRRQGDGRDRRRLRPHSRASAT